MGRLRGQVYRSLRRSFRRPPKRPSPRIPLSVVRPPLVIFESPENGVSSVSPRLGDGLATVSFALGDGATVVSATVGPPSPGFRSSVCTEGGALTPDSEAVESPLTDPVCELPGGISIVSPGRGPRASLMGRLRFGSLVSALTATSGLKRRASPTQTGDLTRVTTRAATAYRPRCALRAEILPVCVSAERSGNPRGYPLILPPPPGALAVPH